MDDDIMTRTLCVEFTEFPGADEAWLEEKARAIGEVLVPRLGGKLEWGQVVVLPDRKGIGLALLFYPGFEHDLGLAETVMKVVFEKTGIELPKRGGKGKARRKDGLPCVGLGPRFPPEFFASHGKIRPVSPVIHSGDGKGKRPRTQKPGRQGA
jgi:hypothetical protein